MKRKIKALLLGAVLLMGITCTSANLISAETHTAHNLSEPMQTGMDIETGHQHTMPMLSLGATTHTATTSDNWSNAGCLLYTSDAADE